MTVLQERIAELAEQHGSLRAAARVLECDAGYLSRLQSGEKDNPEDWLLRRMGLRRVVTYERTSGVVVDQSPPERDQASSQSESPPSGA